MKGLPFSRKTQNIILFPISLQNDWILEVKAFPLMGAKEAQERQ
jgi:hypothetical protein